MAISNASITQTHWMTESPSSETVMSSIPTMPCPTPPRPPRSMMGSRGVAKIRMAPASENQKVMVNSTATTRLSFLARVTSADKVNVSLMASASRKREHTTRNNKLLQYDNYISGGDIKSSAPPTP